MFQADTFKDKVALVSGGRSGIGYAIAKQLLQLGAEVIICSRKEEMLKKAELSLNAFGPCKAYPCDIRNEAQIERLVKEIKAHYSALDILVNNAGGQFPTTAENLSNKGWNTVINNNLNGTWYMTKAMADHFFIPQKSGNIVNIIVNIYRGFPGMIHTGAARAGVDNMTKTLAVEWAKYQININAVAPGLIYSTGFEQYPKEITDNIASKIPMQRLGTTDEVANVVTFLASPMTSYITGETIYIDGGWRLYGDIFEL